MASPSEHPKKVGIRCEGVFPVDHKFAGKACNGLLLEKDLERGLGARCGRCGTFYSLSELLQRVNQSETTQQRKQEEEEKEMVAQATSKNPTFNLLANRLRRDPSGLVRALGIKLKNCGFDPDKIESILGMPFRVYDISTTSGIKLPSYELNWVIERVPGSDISLAFSVVPGDFEFYVSFSIKIKPLVRDYVISAERARYTLQSVEYRLRDPDVEERGTSIVIVLKEGGFIKMSARSLHWNKGDKGASRDLLTLCNLKARK